MSSCRTRLFPPPSRPGSARRLRTACRALALGCTLLLAAACGRPPGGPTPLPPGERVAQPTPDFSAPAQADTATAQNANNAAEAVRNRIAQQRAQPTSTRTSTGDLPTSTPSVLQVHPELAVFDRPTALGIVVGGGALYAAPGAGATVNMQVGTTLTITGRSADGGWYAAYLADGTAGWAAASQVRVFGDAAGLEVVQDSLGPVAVATLIAQASQPQQPFATAAVTPSPANGASPGTAPQPDAPPSLTGPAVTVVVEGANVRAGPGTDFPVVGLLYANDRAALLGRSQGGDWLHVRLPDSLGWIFAPLVETSLPIADLPVVDPPPADEP
ncbi:MAG: SH3 domain-containing protein [Caldilineaceae bacterium]|nr:SH3 domain-containing protein [Caldilineaceae bacterium]